MDVNTLYQQTVGFFTHRVDAVEQHQWELPTPCTAWSVRDLVNHEESFVTGDRAVVLWRYGECPCGPPVLACACWPAATTHGLRSSDPVSSRTGRWRVGTTGR